MSDRIHSAEASSDATDTQRVTEGAWAGFSRSEARAWLRALFDYEPHGFVSPGSQVRVEATRRANQGELPEVFGYPSRAARLRANGLSPETYRLVQRALDRPIFSPSDIRFR